MKTALVGNGLSIAYNRQLSCPALLTTLTARLSTLGSATEVERTLSSLASSLNGAAGRDLEALLGPLDILGGAMRTLGELATLTAVAPQTILNAVGQVEVFTSGVYRTATSHVLDAIATSSRGSGDHDVIDRFADEIIAAGLNEASAPKVSVATLNYDGLLTSGLLDKTGTTDLATGYQSETLTTAVVKGQQPLVGHRLRQRDNLDAETELINLHGSLGWLQRDGEFAKFQIQDLRSQGYWANWRAGASPWAPAVVLTNQQAKSLRVLEYPFQLAYAIFEDRLRRSSHWLIAGYGMADEPVNSAITRAATARESRPTRCLVITLDPSLTPVAAGAKLGLNPAQITVCAHGFPDALDCDDWRDWKAS